ncbi:MAG: TonB-dependent receptor [Desulfovibrionaceae bacterium]|nr:TonB-dependent receptor [Desulfovibrionaceae bacterium]
MSPFPATVSRPSAPPLPTRRSGAPARRAALLFAAALLLAWCADAAATNATNATSAIGADEGYRLAPVMVTAEKRVENLQDVPASVTALSGQDLTDMGVRDTEDLAHYVPNLEFDSFGSRRHGLMFLRGVKSLPTGEPATGYYVDGVNYSKSYMFDFPLFDVERVEVLRGPQGSLYGRNTIGGVVNVVTRQPDNEPRYALRSSVGRFDARELGGSASVPLVEDRLFLGIAGLVSARDGFMVNDTAADGEQGRHQDGKAGRLKLRGRPSDDLDVTLTLDAQRHDDGAYPARLTGRNSLVKAGKASANEAYHYSHDFEGTQENDCRGLTLDVAWRTSLGTFTAITGMRDYASDEDIDADFSALDMMRKHIDQKERTFSQELRLASPDGDGLKWQAGLYGFHILSDQENTNHYRAGLAASPSNPFSPGTGSRLYDTENTNSGAAAFGQVTYPLRKDLELTLGLRVEHERAESDADYTDTPSGGTSAKGGEVSASNDFTSVLPKISLAWRFAEGHTAYATVSEAHRSGGFNGVSAPTGAESFDEEKSWLYEVGLKSRLLEDRLTANLAAFHIAIEDEQLGLFNAANMQSYIANAGRSHRTGLEAELRYRPLPALELSGSFTVMEAEYDSYSDPVAGLDYEGNKVFCVPDYTYTLAAQYRIPLRLGPTLLLRADLVGVGERYFDDANTVRESPYELLNLTVGLETEHLDWRLWAKNVCNTRYVTFENTTMGVAEDGEPISVGLSVDYRF